MCNATKTFGPIGLAVLAFIGRRQTNTQTDNPNSYIDDGGRMCAVISKTG